MELLEASALAMYAAPPFSFFFRNFTDLSFTRPTRQ